jgi:hypothetical protein
MATSYKVLGQAVAVAGSDTTLYTVPTATEAVVSSITVCNRDSASATFRIAVRPDGETLANKHYVIYDVTIDRNSTQALTLGITLNAADVITIRASANTVTFNAYGTEITA